MTFLPSVLWHEPTENIFLYNYNVIISPQKVSIDTRIQYNYEASEAKVAQLSLISATP